MWRGESMTVLRLKKAAYTKKYKEPLTVQTLHLTFEKPAAQRGEWPARVHTASWWTFNFQSNVPCVLLLKRQAGVGTQGQFTQQQGTEVVLKEKVTK